MCACEGVSACECGCMLGGERGGGVGGSGPGRICKNIPDPMPDPVPDPSRTRLLFENEAFVDFQRGNEQKRRRSAAFSRVYYWKNDQPLNFIETGTAAVCAEIRFYLHKEFRRGRDLILIYKKKRGRDGILSTQRSFLRPGADFLYAKNLFKRRVEERSLDIVKIFRAARAKLLRTM